MTIMVMDKIVFKEFKLQTVDPSITPEFGQILMQLTLLKTAYLIHLKLLKSWKSCLGCFTLKI